MTPAVPAAGPAAAAPRVKLVLLGDSVRAAAAARQRTVVCSRALVLLQGVGKSCLVLRYVRGAFDSSSKVTVGAAFMSHSLTLSDGSTLKFEIWCASTLAASALAGSAETEALRHTGTQQGKNDTRLLHPSITEARLLQRSSTTSRLRTPSARPSTGSRSCRRMPAAP